MTPSQLVAEVLALEAEYAAKTSDSVDSKPGPPASEEAIRAAEKARARSFPESYRAFLARTDGWQHLEYGMILYSTSDFVTSYERGYIEEMLDENAEEVPPELASALTIGWSGNDTRLFLLLDDGTVVDWLYEETERYSSIDKLIEERRDGLYRYAQRNAIDVAAAYLPTALALAKEQPSILHNAACIFTRLGQLERALDCVEQAKELGYVQMGRVQVDDDLEPLRKSPRWTTALAK